VSIVTRETPSPLNKSYKKRTPEEVRV